MTNDGTSHAATAIEPQQVAQRIEAQEEAALPNLRWWSSPDYQKLFQPIEKEVDSFVNQLINGPAVEETKIDSLVQTIKARRERLPLSSGITDQIIGICKQVLAFGAAGIALTVTFIDKVKAASPQVQKILATIGVFYLELIGLSLFILAWYMLQARFRYPFLYFEKIGNAWPFFYYSSISTDVSRHPIQLASTRLHAAARYGTDFLEFAKKCIEEKPRERLRAELQQYYLLMAYSAYVHQFSLQLANIFFYGLIGSLLTATILGIAVWGGIL